MLPKFSCITVFVLDVQQRLQPLRAHSLSLPRILRTLGLVKPMRGDASLGNHVHGLGAYLKLDVCARWANQGGVQRLVAVEFADGYMVLETPWERFVKLVQHAQCCVAVYCAGHYQTKTVDVIDIGKA